MPSRRRTSVWYLSLPKPSEDTARTTFIHRGIMPLVAPKRLRIARHEKVYRVRSIVRVEVRPGIVFGLHVHRLIVVQDVEREGQHSVGALIVEVEPRPGQTR